MSVFISYIKSAGSVNSYVNSSGKRGFCSRTAISVITPGSIACYGFDDTVCIHFSDSSIPIVRNIKIAGKINGHARQTTKLGFGGWTSITTKASFSIPHTCNSRDDTVNVHLSDDIFPMNRNIKVSKGINIYINGSGKSGFRSRTAIPTIAPSSIACHRSNNAMGIYLSDDVAIIICDIEISSRIKGNSSRRTKLGIYGGTFLATDFAFHCIDY